LWAGEWRTGGDVSKDLLYSPMLGSFVEMLALLVPDLPAAIVTDALMPLLKLQVPWGHNARGGTVCHQLPRLAGCTFA
jgi:hypothetical protein